MSINILAEDQQAIADRFAGRVRVEDCEERFSGADWDSGITGAPLLVDALVALDCTITQMFVLDTHAILVGQVEQASFGVQRPPLVHFDAGFMNRSLPIAPAPSPVYA